MVNDSHHLFREMKILSTQEMAMDFLQKRTILITLMTIWTIVNMWKRMGLLKRRMLLRIQKKVLLEISDLLRFKRRKYVARTKSL